MIHGLTPQENQKFQNKLKQIEQFFQPKTSPNHFLTYQEFLNNFSLNDNNYKDQNRNIIDVHLRYRWWVREEMAPYKWFPIILFSRFLYKHFLLFTTIPYLYCSFFDYYFQHFFIWRYKDVKSINIRNQFICKLSKKQNLIRRLGLFNNLKPFLQQKHEYPEKYIKFGQYTDYIFHSLQGDRELSCILDTTIFKAISNVTSPIKQKLLSKLYHNMSSFYHDFINFRKDPNRKKCLININELIGHKSIKQVQLHTLEANIEHNIRRFFEILGYWRRGDVVISQFSLANIFNFSKYQNILQPYRFNIKDNSPDLLLYYTLLGVPKLFKMIFRKR